MTDHLLVASGLTAGYDKTEILHALDLTIPPRKITVIVGANACGKSTFLRTLSRLIAPARGKFFSTANPSTGHPREISPARWVCCPNRRSRRKASQWSI